MTDFLMGKNTILEILKHKKEIIIEIYTAKAKTDPMILDLMKKIPVKFVSKKTLDNLANSTSHQGILAKIKPRNYLNPKDFIKKNEDKSKSLVLMLDSIFDPQNLGAIIRTAECFSVDGVIFSKNRGADITPVVSKASMGGSELVNLIKVSNLANAIDIFYEAGYSIVATTLEKDSKDLYEFKFPDKTLLIMGSEGVGVQKLLLKRAEYKIFIPMQGKLQSLNVSAASAIVLSYIRAQAN
ncbi:MAG: 23S rRNA (guanosine-2'-O-)-methyltransferase RlmB [Candidatus Anoxychlamydiales bacterium]|nr:23S rRNA (guanosine-2'-O-)-methyltransferase RlmB [Candidatus Anoxychlamydiales bacterium]